MSGLPDRNASAALLALLLLALTTSPATAGKLYRWTDKNGQTHYTDRIPLKHLDQARSHLNKRGIEVKKVDAAKTREQLEQEEELRRLRAEKKRLIDQQRAKDRVLLRTFRSSDDIVMTRDGKLSAIDTSIQITRSNIQQLKLRLGNMQKSAADLERQGKSISRKFLKEIKSTRQQIRNSYGAIIHKERGKQRIREKYAVDLARFSELKNQRPEKGISLSDQKRHYSLLETVVVCENQENCDTDWKLAEKYVRANATTRIQMLSRNIIMTASPVTDKDISITAARIHTQGTSEAHLFMDLQCKPSPQGRNLCASETVDRIRKGFRAFLRKRPLKPPPGRQPATVTPETAAARSAATVPPSGREARSGNGFVETGEGALPAAPASTRHPAPD